VSAFYVLAHQRLRFPWESVYHVNAEFTVGAGGHARPGPECDRRRRDRGTDLHVHLHDGRAVVGMEIEPGKLPAVYDQRPHAAAPEDRAERHVDRAGSGCTRRGAGCATAAR